MKVVVVEERSLHNPRDVTFLYREKKVSIVIFLLNIVVIVYAILHTDFMLTNFVVYTRNPFLCLFNSYHI